MRERPAEAPAAPAPAGITPARAGKTFAIIVTSLHGQDHPRSCGKDSTADMEIYMNSGSPPLVRERHTAGHGAKASDGITPARAGKTRRSVRRRFLFRDHPRSCGKDVYSNALAGAAMGSPPLVRERRFYRRVRGLHTGITPARAGKTGIIGHNWFDCQDHPRSCGKDHI